MTDKRRDFELMRQLGEDLQDHAEEQAACDPHAFPSDPEGLQIVETYGDGAEVAYTCPRCGEPIVAELLTTDMRVLPEGRDGEEVRA